MPRLLIFAPCEKVIIGQEDNSASLISLLRGMKVNAPPDQQTIPEGTVVPLTWYVFTLWNRVPEDADKEFEQYVKLVAPDGTELAKTEHATFEMKRLFHRVSSRITGFPVWKLGDLELQLYWRERDENKECEWIMASSYPVGVEFIPDQVAQTAGVSGTEEAQS